MSERFLKFIPSDKSNYLLTKHPNAFILLCIIAQRARRYEGHIDGLHIGECYVGDIESYGMTEQKYRTAKKVLTELKIVEIVETCRNRKKSTTGTTTVGTKIRILDSSVWDINSEEANDRNNDRPTTDQRPDNDEQERKRKNKKEERIEHIAQTTSSLRKEIVFSFELRSFQNIEQQDLLSWKELYSSIDIQRELLKMVEWNLSNPTKAKSKKNWRKFISLWLGKSNEQAVNKSAYQSFSKITPIDRRTQNTDGTPVSSPADGRF